MQTAIQTTAIDEETLPSGSDTAAPAAAATATYTTSANWVIGLTGLAGAVTVCLAMRPYLLHLDHLPLIFILAAAALGAWRLSAYGSWVKLSIIPVVAAAYAAGPAGGALAGLASGLGGALQTRSLNRKIFLNTGASALAGGLGGLLGAQVIYPFSSLLVDLLLFGTVSAVSTNLASGVFACLFLWANEQVNPVKAWRERFQWMLPQALLLGQVGTGVAVAYHYAGPYELLAFATPVVAAQLSWRQYLAHTTRSVEDLRGKNADLIQLAARLQSANDAVLNTYRGTLEALVGALDARDNEVQGHSYRVSAYSQVVAEQMGVERGSPDWEAILRGALLHDVGKIGVRDAVLLKPGKLDEREWTEMRAHSEIGFGILRDVEFLRPAATLVRAHHERFDGAGYPLGLKGEQIPLGARIFSVCDTFDAITTDRPYRRAAPPAAAVAEILRCTGTQFDPEVVTVFEQVWPQLWALRAKASEMVA
ncbi:MAG: HD-GYP domain-containing protein [Dehalococcoidia bacterium]